MRSWHMIAALSAGLASCNIDSQRSLQEWEAHEQSLVSELGTRLSDGARIILPDSDSADYPDASSRWSEYCRPALQAVISIANENDVRQTIRYARDKGLPFITKVSGHGSWSALRSLQGGLQISMRQLNYTRVSGDGKSAVIGGGALSKEVTDALWAAGKYTATGGCDSVGMTGPIAGGGSCWVEGQHGLITDNLIEARMILANGTAVTVSENSHSDLFWATRGAGHNFGVITEIKSKIYDVIPGSTWAYQTLTFHESQLERVFSTMNELRDTLPPQAAAYAGARIIPDLDPENPVIEVNYIYDGPLRAALQLTKPLLNLPRLSLRTGTVPYPNLNAHMTGRHLNDTSSATTFHHSSYRYTHKTYPIGLPCFPVQSIRHIFNSLTTLIHSHNGSFKSSYILFELFAHHAVDAIPSNSTAYAHRSDRVVIAANPSYLTPFFPPSGPDSDTDADSSDLDANELAAVAMEYGRHFREVLLAGSGQEELHAYVNYAHGDESLEALYGYEPWRLQKLRRLKRIYDPEQRFGWFGGIPPA